MDQINLNSDSETITIGEMTFHKTENGYRVEDKNHNDDCLGCMGCMYNIEELKRLEKNRISKMNV
jgi:hypothetical protein